MFEKQIGLPIKKLRTDNGLECCNNEFDDYLTKNGIIHQKTVTYTPQQNCVAERFNRTIVEKTRCMLIDAQLKRVFWAEAVTTSVYVLNRIPCKGSGSKTPEELWSNEKPAIMRVFGCVGMVHIPKEKRKKLDPKSMKCIFLGYSDVSKAYRLYNPETRKIVYSRDVEFIEGEMIKVTDKKKDEINFVYYILLEEEEMAEKPPETLEIAESEENGVNEIDMNNDTLEGEDNHE